MKKDLIPLFKVYMSKKASKEASKIINSGYIGQGPIVDKFENELSNYLELGKRFVMTTNSATAAEHLALHMLKKSGRLTKHYPEYGGASFNDWVGMEDGDEVL